jgi:hypothetical protein
MLAFASMKDSVTTYASTAHEESSALTAQERLISVGGEYTISSVVVIRIG